MKKTFTLLFVFLFTMMFQIKAQKDSTAALEKIPQYIPPPPKPGSSAYKSSAEPQFSCSEE